MPPRHPAAKRSLAASAGSNGSWANILDAVNANAEDGGNGGGGGGGLGPKHSAANSSWGSLDAPFRRRSFGSISASGSTDAAVMQRDPSGVAFKAVISGAMHFDFTDIALVAPLATTMLGVVGVGGRDVHDILSASVLRFLRQYNHPRAPDAAAPSADELERLRASLLSHTPVANVAPAERWGFKGGHRFGYHGPDGDAAAARRRRARGVPLKFPNLPKIKVGQMGHPANHHRGVRGGLALGVARKSTSSRAWRHYRRSFDATHLPENWMELESIPGSPSKIDEDEDDVDLSVEVSPDETDAEEGNGLAAVAEAGAEAAGRGPESDPDPVEARPRIVRWVRSHEWRVPEDRAFTPSQRREMRWLLHECENLGTAIQPSDFIAMFPSFSIEAIRRCATEELDTVGQHPPPKPLVWKEQMVIDGDVPRRKAEGGNHLGIDDEDVDDHA